MPTLSVMETLLGPAELAQLLGVSRQRASVIAGRVDFPRPRLTLIMGSIWALDDVKAWADKRGRILNLDALTTDVQAGDDSTP